MESTAQAILIREATVADIPQLCDLLTLLFTQEADFQPNSEAQIAGLSSILKQPNVGRIYCASRDTLVLGMVSLLFTVSTAEGGPAAWLEDMIVHPAWRDRQVGARLLEFAIEQSREAGIQRITLLTDCHNHRAIDFYRRAGFTQSSMIPFRLKL
jgi:ribosomal protein S18 acetylase RimI-like enzyme